MGRPTKYTTATVNKIIKSLKQGNTRTRAAHAAGISHETFAQWLNEYPDFSEQCTRAEDEAVSSRVGILTDSIQAAYNTGDFATAGRLSVEYLKRKDRQNWGDNVNVDLISSIEASVAELAALRAAEATGGITGADTGGQGKSEGPGGIGESA